MKADFKKRLRVVQEKLEEIYDELSSINEDFESWYDDHEDKWFDSPTCEKADDEKYEIENFVSDCESLKDNIDNLINQ